MAIRLKILLRILIREPGIKGALFLLVTVILSRFGKDYATFYIGNILPASLFVALFFEFKINNKKFLQQLSFLPDYQHLIKFFSLIWSVIFTLMILTIQLLVYKSISFQILIAVINTSLIISIVLTYIFSKSQKKIVFILIMVLSIILLKHEISLLVNVILMIATFYYIEENPFDLFSITHKPPFVTNFSNETESNITPGNYFIKFLKITVMRNDVHKFAINTLLFISLIIEFYMILTLIKDGTKALEFIYFIIFAIPVILNIILTYLLILGEKPTEDDQFLKDTKEIHSQLSKKYLPIFYSLIGAVFLTIIIINPMTTLNLSFLSILISLPIFAHFSFTLLITYKNHIINSIITIAIGVFLTVITTKMKLGISLIMFIIYLTHIKNRVI